MVGVMEQQRESRTHFSADVPSHSRLKGRSLVHDYEIGSIGQRVEISAFAVVLRRTRLGKVQVNP